MDLPEFNRRLYTELFILCVINSWNSYMLCSGCLSQFPVFNTAVKQKNQLVLDIRMQINGMIFLVSFWLMYL